MTETDTSVLGKRVRNNQEELKNDHQVASNMSATFDDNDDDDLGPMPMPAGAEGVSKKKRKGKARII